MNKSKFSSVLKFITPDRIRKFIRDQLVSYSMEKSPSMSVKTEKELKTFFKKDIKDLSQLLNKDLRHWIE